MAVLRYIVYSSAGCGYCLQAKRLLEHHEIPFDYLSINLVSSEEQQKMMEIAGKQFQTVPQIFKERTDGIFYVGGFEDLKEELK